MAADAQKAANEKAVADHKRTEDDKVKAEADEKAKNALPEGDDDIDAINPKDNAPTKTKSEFAQLREIAKNARKSAREQSAKVAEISKLNAELAEKSKSASPEVMKELEELKTYRQRMELANDPELQKEFSTKGEAADDALLRELVHQGMKQDVADELKKDGLQNKNQQWWENEVLARIKSPLNQAKVVDLLRARDRVSEEKQQKLELLTKDRDSFFKEREQVGQKHLEQWQTAARAKAIEVAMCNEFMLHQEMPKDATPEQKTIVDEHNKRTAEYIKEGQARIAGCYGRNPEITAEVVMKSIKSDHLEKEVARLTEEKMKSDARVKALEGKLGAVRDAGKIGSLESAPATREAKAAPKMGQTAHEAMNEFFANK